MLPTMQRLNRSRTAEVVRIGHLQLYFSFFNLIGFQIDGQHAVVCAETHRRTTTTKHLLLIEPDKSKWITHLEFTQKWMENSKKFLST